MKPLKIYLLVLSVAFYAFSCGSKKGEFYEEGVSLELAKYRQSTITGLRYALHITIPEAYEKPIFGEETIALELSDLANDLLLDFKVPVEYLHEVMVNGQLVTPVFEKEHIQIDSEDLQLGKNEIFIKFRMGETSLNRNEEYLYTLFVPERARTAFPCFDQPNLKATFSLTLDIPAHWQALANGAMIKEDNSGGMKTLNFVETQPIPTYLFDFVAGEFTVVERVVGGREMTMLHRETDLEKVERNIDQVFELHQTAISWLEDYTGIDYPFGKFGFALIPSFQYGGMEHPGAITYKAESLFLGETPTQNQLLGRASLIAHETAHMWFGDLVTMDWFNDVWMKEVFANFMAAKIVNPSFPEINHDLRFLLAHYPSAYAVDRSKGTHPIQQELANLKDAGTLYGAIIYQKAPIAMRMLERNIGTDRFRQGLQSYLTKYAYKNATWDNLIAELDQLTDENMEQWSTQWIKNAGMPSVFPFIRTNEDESIRQFSLYQRNFDGNDDLWTQDLTVLLVANDSTYTKKIRLEKHGLNIEEWHGLHDATFIMCNSEGYGYGYFNLGPLTKSHWLEHIEDFENPVHRGVGWLSLYESMLRRAVSTEDYMKTIIRNLPIESDPLIQQFMLNSLRTVFWKLITPEDRVNNAEGIEQVLWERMQTMEDNRLKRAYFNIYKSVAISAGGVEKLYGLWRGDLKIDGLSMSENDLTQLACELAIRGRPDSEEILKEQLAGVSNKDRKERLEFLFPSLSTDQQVRDAFFESLKDVDNRHHESWVQNAIGNLHHPLRAQSSTKYIIPTLEMLEEIQQTGDIFFPKRVLDNTFSGHSSDEAVDAVRQFLYRNNHYPKNLKNKILQSSDMTFRAYERLSDRPDSVKVVLFE